MKIQYELINWALNGPKELADRTNLINALILKERYMQIALGNLAKDFDYINGELQVPEETILDIKIIFDNYIAEVLDVFTTVDLGVYKEKVESRLKDIQ